MYIDSKRRYETKRNVYFKYTENHYLFEEFAYWETAFSAPRSFGRDSRAKAIFMSFHFRDAVVSPLNRSAVIVQ